jgi:hypothetical protein
MSYKPTIVCSELIPGRYLQLLVWAHNNRRPAVKLGHREGPAAGILVSRKLRTFVLKMSISAVER